MKRFFATILVIAVGIAANAQKVDHINNLQVNVGGGFHSYFYDPVDGSLKPSYGGLIEAQYQLFFNHYVGLGFGLQLSSIQGKVEYDFRHVAHMVDYPGSGLHNWDVTSDYDITERQYGILASVPIQMLFRLPCGNGAFQLGLGVTLDYIFDTRYTTEGTITRLGYCAEVNQTLGPDLTHDFLTVKDDQDDDYDFKNKVNVGILADVGYTFNCSNAVGIYVGLYGNIGMMNYIDDAAQGRELMEVNIEGKPYAYNGTFNSNRTDKVVPIEAGIKLGIRLGCGKKIGWKAEKAAAEARAKADAEVQAKAEAEARAKAAAEAKAEKEKLIREKAAAEARAKAEAEARAKAEADAAANKENLNREKAAAETRAKSEAEARAKAEQAAREEVAFLAGYKDVAHFATGKDTPIFDKMNEDSWINLKNVMDKHAEIKVIITGHTDNVGRAASNLKLSQQRADNVKAMLVEKGIDAARITAVGKGQTEPIADNATPEGRNQNRRVEITVGK